MNTHDCSIIDCRQFYDCFIREFECSFREYQFIVWNVNKTTGKEVRPKPDWLLHPEVARYYDTSWVTIPISCTAFI